MRSGRFTFDRFILAALSFLAPNLGAQVNQWEMIGPSAASVFSYARHPANPDLLLVGTHFGGVYRAQDGGFTWEHLDSGFASAAVFALTADPINPGRFYAGTFERGVYVTNDSGETWRTLNEGLTNRSISSIAVNPYEAQELLLTTFDGIFRSEDGGENWTAPSPNTNAVLPALHLFFSTATEGVCYAGTNGSGVLRSIDSGVTWADWSAGVEGATVLWLTAHPDRAGELYLASNRGVFRRAEGETSWTDLNFNLPEDGGANQVAFHPDKRLFAATNLGVFTLQDREAEQWFNWSLSPSRFVLIEPFGNHIHLAESELRFSVSFDDGQSFANAATGIQNVFPDALTSTNKPSGGSHLFAGTDIGPLRGSGPTSVPPFGWLDAERIDKELVLELRADPAQPEVLYAGTERAGVWKTTDAGETWIQSSKGIYPTTITSLSQSIAGDHTMYAGTSVGLFISRDEGRTWSVGPEVAIPSFVTAVENDAVAPEVAYFGTNFGQFLRTIDNGLSFQSTASLPGERIEKMVSARFRDVFAVLGSGRVYSSSDQGITWNPKDQDLDHPGADLDFNQSEPWKGYLATKGGGVYKTASEGTAWQQVNNGIDNLFILSIAVDQNTPSSVYAGSVGAVYKSFDEGGSWEKFTAGLPTGKLVTRLLLNPGNSSELYAVVLGEGIYYSSNAGESWTLRSGVAAFRAEGGVPLAVSYGSPGEVFSGSEQEGIFRSSNEGVTWEPSSTGVTDLVRGIQVSHQESGRVYAATLNSGVFRSEDGGADWEQVGLRGRRLINLAIDRFNHNHLWASTSEGVAASFDGGESWQDLGQRLSFVYSLLAAPSDLSTLYIGGPGGEFYSSPDEGRTSVKGGEGLPDSNILALSGTSGALYAGMGFGQGIYQSGDAGQSWEKISGTLFSNERVTEVVYEPVFDQLFVVGDKSGLVTGLSDGSAWQTIATPGGDPIENPVSHFRISSLDPNFFVLSKFSATQEAYSLFTSRDRGASWTMLSATSGLPAGSIRALALSEVNLDVMMASLASGVYLSLDGGLTWTPRSTGLTGTILALHFDPQNDQRVFAGSEGGGIYHSEDQGRSWEYAATNPPDRVVSRFVNGADGVIHAATYTGGVLTSRDGGKEWSAGIEPGMAKMVANFISVDPANPRTLYMATTAQGPLKSTDGGYSWRKISEGLGPHLTALTILVDPLDPDVVYLGTNTNGVYVSETAGESWEQLRAGMLHELVIALSVDAVDHRTIYAGTEGGGVYRLKRPPKFLAADRDPDQDGIPSIEEEFMGLDPLSPNPPGRFEAVLNSAVGGLSLLYQASAQSTPVDEELEWSPDLLNWYRSGEGPEGGTEIFTQDLGLQPEGYRLHRASLPSEQRHRFLRLRYRRSE